VQTCAGWALLHGHSRDSVPRRRRQPTVRVLIAQASVPHTGAGELLRPDQLPTYGSSRLSGAAMSTRPCQRRGASDRPVAPGGSLRVAVSGAELWFFCSRLFSSFSTIRATSPDTHRTEAGIAIDVMTIGPSSSESQSHRVLPAQLHRPPDGHDAPLGAGGGWRPVRAAASLTGRRRTQERSSRAGYPTSFPAETRHGRPHVCRKQRDLRPQA
jgi:hypothetical protein